mmetsp:Transcript_13577/g.17886  ORF Transcript_13577/g.17886 Transcript_13577/m.17886 type:complete len:234 (+) Transcript_13577:68-769(+)
MKMQSTVLMNTVEQKLVLRMIRRIVSKLNQILLIVHQAHKTRTYFIRMIQREMMMLRMTTAEQDMVIRRIKSKASQVIVHQTLKIPRDLLILERLVVMRSILKVGMMKVTLRKMKPVMILKIMMMQKKVVVRTMSTQKRSRTKSTQKRSGRKVKMKAINKKKKLLLNHHQIHTRILKLKVWENLPMRRKTLLLTLTTQMTMMMLLTRLVTKISLLQTQKVLEGWTLSLQRTCL